PDSLVLRDPLLDLDRKDVIIEFRLELAKASPQFLQDVRRQRYDVPMLTLTKNAHTSADKIDVCPAHTKRFSAAQPRALHQQNGRPLMGESRGSQLRELIHALAIDVCA